MADHKTMADDWEELETAPSVVSLEEEDDDFDGTDSGDDLIHVQSYAEEVSGTTAAQPQPESQSESPSQPQSSPQPESQYESLHSLPQPQPRPQPESQPKPLPKPQPQAQPESQPKPLPQDQPESQSKPPPRPQSCPQTPAFVPKVLQLQALLQLDSQPRPQSKPKPEPQPESQPKPDTTAQPAQPARREPRRRGIVFPEPAPASVNRLPPSFIANRNCPENPVTASRAREIAMHRARRSDFESSSGTPPSTGITRLGMALRPVTDLTKVSQQPPKARTFNSNPDAPSGSSLFGEPYSSNTNNNSYPRTNRGVPGPKPQQSEPMTQANLYDAHDTDPATCFDALQALFRDLQIAREHVSRTSVKDDVDFCRIYEALDGLAGYTTELEPILSTYSQHWSRLGSRMMGDIPLDAQIILWIQQTNDLARAARIEVLRRAVPNRNLVAGTSPAELATKLEGQAGKITEYMPIIKADFDDYRAPLMAFPEGVSDGRQGRPGPPHPTLVRVRRELYQLKDSILLIHEQLTKLMATCVPGRIPQCKEATENMGQLAESIVIMLTNHNSDWIESDLSQHPRILPYSRFVALDPDVLHDVAGHLTSLHEELSLNMEMEVKTLEAMQIVRQHQIVQLTECGRMLEIVSTLGFLNALLMPESEAA